VVFYHGQDGARRTHSSLVDAKVQAEINADKRFLAFIDRPESIKAMRKYGLEKGRGLVCQRDGRNQKMKVGREIQGRKHYEGSQGGDGSYGPMSKVL
jgi:hypothetical protein